MARYGPFFNCHDIDNSFGDDYAELGLTPEDITAEYLASATHITEFYFNVEMKNGKELGADFILSSISFEDENGSEYIVSPALLGRTIRAINDD